MNVRAEQFPFVDHGQGEAARLPYLPLALTLGTKSITIEGLVDSGSTINVLPYDLGIQLGAVWEQQTIPVQLTGNLAREEARALVVAAQVGGFSPVRFAFAWTKLTSVPVILGQINFFLEFDICLFRSRGVFEVRPK